MSNIVIRIDRVIKNNFGDKELDLAEKIHLCSLLEEEFDINIDYFANKLDTKEDFYKMVKKLIGEKDANY